MKQYYGLSPEVYGAVVALVDDRLREIYSIRRDHEGLKSGQERLESRIDRVEAMLDRLAEAQDRTEKLVEELAQALPKSG